MSVEIISTVLVAATASAPASPYDLTDLATAKDELGLTSADTGNDPFLSRGITQSSAIIANYCNRIFALETLQDQIFIQSDHYPFQTPGGIYPLQLSRWPLSNWQVIAFTGNTHGTTTIDGIASTAGIVAGMPVFAIDGSIPAGALVQTVNPTSLVLTLATKTSVTGLSCNTGLQVIQTQAVGVTQTLVYGQDYTIDAERGWLIRLNPYFGNSTRWETDTLTVQYQAGFAATPADLTEACLRLVTARYRAKGRDPTLIERTIPQTVGTERWWVGSAAGQTGAMPPDIEAMVDQYRVPSVN